MPFTHADRTGTDDWGQEVKVHSMISAPDDGAWRLATVSVQFWVYDDGVVEAEELPWRVQGHLEQALRVPRPRPTPRARVATARPCTLCGEQFSATRHDAEFCSARCRQQAVRRRRRGEVVERPRREVPAWIVEQERALRR